MLLLFLASLSITLNKQGHTHAPRDTPKRGKFPNHVVGASSKQYFIPRNKSPSPSGGDPQLCTGLPLFSLVPRQGPTSSRGPRELGTWAERWVKPKELSVGKSAQDASWLGHCSREPGVWLGASLGSVATGKASRPPDKKQKHCPQLGRGSQALKMGFVLPLPDEDPPGHPLMEDSPSCPFPPHSCLAPFF